MTESKIGFWRITIFIVILLVIIGGLLGIGALAFVVGFVQNFLTILLLPIIGLFVSAGTTAVIVGAYTLVLIAAYILMIVVSMILTWSAYGWLAWFLANLIWPLPWIWRIFGGRLLWEN